MTTDHLWLSGNDEADELLTRDDPPESTDWGQ